MLSSHVKRQNDVVDEMGTRKKRVSTKWILKDWCWVMSTVFHKYIAVRKSLAILLIYTALSNKRIRFNLEFG